MASDIDKGNFGDSARNTTVYELKSRNSNHIFDGAGENIQYYSDSESVASRKSKTRYINPAIYIEPVESTHSVTSLQADSCISDVTPHPHSSYRSNSTPLLSGRDSSISSGSVKRKSCRLTGAGNLQGAEEETPRTPFGRTYRDDGPDTFRLSVASVSTTTTAKDERERNEKKKQEAFKQWVARKDQEKRDKARLEKMKRQVVPTTSQEQREESYRRWLERKRTQTERQRAEDIMRQYRHNEQLERERNKRERDKEEKLAEWIRRKEEEMKAMKTREERRAARAAIEEERRRANGDRAYRDWLRTSKNKPLPVPLNQGELSMRGSVSQMYINPIPWQFPT
ncbi:coiled-coil domain-containing protein 181-like [Helicoverpa zea]|uniref:coiled-coil domain-containing protein 181-like n=1 Tax=Helicoverpa zea TaxID=7113 RepID=UPI001F56795D|nr:coiled-coil domain-containing protein 181-like [Helicoverpa zea]XP_047029598.1 coiled-coil domain-containing protein 181-like [Helicoverpa zea]